MKAFSLQLICGVIFFMLHSILTPWPSFSALLEVADALDLKQIEMHALSLVSGMPGYTQAYITQIGGASGLERGAGSSKVLMKT